MSRVALAIAGRTYRIEGDFSSASYFLAMGAVCGGQVRVRNLNRKSPQGDRRFPDILEEMGCRVRWNNEEIILESDGSLSGVDVEMSGSPDTVQTLCAVAAFARTPTRISGIGHLRHKESDRIRRHQAGTQQCWVAMCRSRAIP